MNSSEQEKIVREAMSILGRRGKGKSKVRGDAEYYAGIARARWGKQATPNTPEHKGKH